MKLSPDEQKKFDSWMARVAAATDDVLAESLPRSGTRLPEDRLWECMRYSVFSGGKRLRPALVHGAYALCGGKKLERAAKNERHCDRPGIHHQNMLESKRQKLGNRQKLIDRMNVLRHGSAPTKCRPAVISRKNRANDNPTARGSAYV